MTLPKPNFRLPFSHVVVVGPKRSVRTFNRMLLILLEIVVPAFLATGRDDDDDDAFLSCFTRELCNETWLMPTTIMAAPKTIVSITTSDDKSVDEDHIDPETSCEAAGMPWLS